VHTGALAAAKLILGSRRVPDAKAFANLVLARFDGVDSAFRELYEFDPAEMGLPEYHAVCNKLMVTAHSSVSALAIESLQLAALGMSGPGGSERRRRPRV